MTLADVSNREPALDATQRDRRSRRIRQLAWIALLLALAYLLSRGVWRAVGYDQDLNVGYAAGQAWLFGQNPYDPDVLRDILVRSGNADIAYEASLAWRLNVYFPTTLPLFLLVSFLPYGAASILVIALNVAACFAILWVVLRLLGWSWDETRALWLVAFFLALAPVHATIAAGQTGLFALLALVLAFWLEASGRDASAGLAYGLGTAFKVQVALPFVAYAAWRRRWTTAAWSALVIGALTLISVVRMNVAEVPWLTSWLANIATLSEPGGLNDPGTANTQRFALVNLQFALSSVIDSQLAVQAITIAVVGSGAFALVWLIRERHRRNELLALSIVGVLGLMVTYHRYYDAVVLVLPIAWAIGALASERRRFGLAVLALCATYLVPVQTALIEAETSGLVPAWLVDSFLWDVMLLPLHAWVLVVLCLVLLGAVASSQGRSADEPRREGDGVWA